jgi:3-dehydroquinate synthase
MKHNIIPYSAPKQTVSCDVHVGQGILPAIDKIIGSSVSGVCVVSDMHARTPYAETVIARLATRVPNMLDITLKGGEYIKSLDTVEQIYRTLFQKQFDRKALLIAIGGGTITDTASFAAATYMRGIDYMSIPTTLLAQVDAGIGGKTGVNFAQSKNIIGAFAQPKAIVIDTDTLTSLPEKEVSAGFAEIIKYALILDHDLWQSLERYTVSSMPKTVLHKIITTCVNHKIAIVTQDEHDNGIRAVLNFGHTIGHAIENVTNQYNHGQAVAIGMVGATMMSINKLNLNKQVLPRLLKLLDQYQLPTHSHGLNPHDILTAMQHDKKNSNGQTRWILLDQIGSAKYNQQVDKKEIISVLKALCK